MFIVADLVSLIKTYITLFLLMLIRDSNLQPIQGTSGL